ncbi:MAG: adenylate kinase [Clostridiaceae bacterium]|jgi:adenylate kinase|nr:adenylate kinase [Clostridiaceae bacterium]
MKKELIFLGPPACGKGTQTSKLSEYLNFPHIDTGSLLRAEIKNGTENGKIAKGFIDKGELVPVELVAKIIEDRLSQNDCKNGYILDGYPRSVEQADKLTVMNKNIDGSEKAEFRAIYFEIDTNILVERIVNRRSCPKCGEIYNLAFKAPKKDGICDKCGTELTQRKDDTREVAQSRFDTYNNETAPLIEYYKNKGVLKSIDANGSIDEVWERLLKAVND